MGLGRWHLGEQTSSYSAASIIAVSIPNTTGTILALPSGSGVLAGILVAFGSILGTADVATDSAAALSAVSVSYTA